MTQLVLLYSVHMAAVVVAGVGLRVGVLPGPAPLGSGVRGAIELLRSRDWRFLGALAWWGFDIGVLWACCHAFGGSPELSVLVLVYFVGMRARLRVLTRTGPAAVSRRPSPVR